MVNCLKDLIYNCLIFPDIIDTLFQFQSGLLLEGVAWFVIVPYVELHWICFYVHWNCFYFCYFCWFCLFFYLFLVFTFILTTSQLFSDSIWITAHVFQCQYSFLVTFSSKQSISCLFLFLHSSTLPMVLVFQVLHLRSHYDLV